MSSPSGLDDAATASTPPSGGRRYLRGSALYSAATVSRSATGLAVIPFLVGTLPSHEFGIVMLMMPLWWIGQGVLSLGASEGIARAVARSDHAVAHGALMLCALVIAPMTALALGVFALGSSWLIGVDWSAAIAWGVAAAGLQSLLSCSLNTLQGELAVREATIGLFGFAFIPQIVGVGTVLLRGGTATSYLAGYAAGMVVVILIAWAAAWSIARPHFDAEARSVVRTSCRLGLPATPQMVAIQVADLGARRIVLATAGIAAVGTFGVAAACGNLIWNLIKSASQAWAPTLYKTAEEDVAALVRKTQAQGLTVALAGMAVGLLSLPVVELLLPDSYDGAGFTASAAVFLASAPAGLSFVLASGLAFRYERTSVMAWSTPLLAALILVAMWAVVQVTDWSVAGATLATMYVSSGAVLAWYVRKQSPVQISTATAVAALAIGSGIVCSLMRDLGVGWYMAASAIVAAGFVGVSVLLLRRVRSAA